MFCLIKLKKQLHISVFFQCFLVQFWPPPPPVIPCLMIGPWFHLMWPLIYEVFIYTTFIIYLGPIVWLFSWEIPFKAFKYYETTATQNELYYFIILFLVEKRILVSLLPKLVEHKIFSLKCLFNNNSGVKTIKWSN